MKITQHAVEQYQSRHRPEVTVPVAHAELRDAMETATRVKRAPSGGDVYECRSGLRTVTKWERGELIVVTVLPSNGDVDLAERGVAPLPYDPRPDLGELHAYLRSREAAGDRRAHHLLRRCSGLWA